uniref:Uncharacterized protein n=1 Tax=Candidatus Kentrum sp. UNK TaxID=2126344 RepID=A0A451AR62_9GAMM|nr:MAG: hypothetical protein BECKUNK1418H_GA0071006_100321 [Candidatus Kentron sp. UNK]
MFAIPCWGSFLAPTLLVPLGWLNYEIRWFDGGFYALFRMPGSGTGWNPGHSCRNLGNRFPSLESTEIRYMVIPVHRVASWSWFTRQNPSEFCFSDT